MLGHWGLGVGRAISIESSDCPPVTGTVPSDLICRRHTIGQTHNSWQQGRQGRRGRRLRRQQRQRRQRRRQPQPQPQPQAQPQPPTTNNQQPTTNNNNQQPTTNNQQQPRQCLMWLMDKISQTSWYVEYPIINRALTIQFVPRSMKKGSSVFLSSGFHYACLPTVHQLISSPTFQDCLSSEDGTKTWLPANGG